MMSRRLCLAQLASTSSIRGGGPYALQSDAELRALGAELWRRWSVEETYAAIGDWLSYETANQESQRVARAISTLPATSIAGLGEKASAAAWCHGGTPLIENDGETIDAILLDSLVRDLLRLIGRPRRPIPTRIIA